jgi:hypothetical protein
MSLVLADRVRETTQTTGTGTITLDGAVQGFQSFAVIGNNNTTYYTINRGLEWEVGVGTYYGGTLSRDTVYESSNSNNKVNFSAGSKDVFVTLPSEQAVTSGTDVTFTKVTTPTVQATNSGGLSLKNSAGTTQISMGGGGGDNVSINVATNINGANAQIDISPTGTGHVHIKPTGSGSLEIAPISVGVMDNMTIGATTPAAGTFTTLTSTGQANIGTGFARYLIATGSASGSPGMYATAGSLTFSGGGGAGLNFYSNLFTALQLNITHTASAVNYPQLTGAVTGSGPVFSAQGSDTNISQVFQSKGTGAIDLAAGSSGVNISNGGTVTAITRTTGGTGYTTLPTVAVSAPTTAGGVQATLGITIWVESTPTVVSGGTGYTNGDVLTLSGGTFTVAATLTVTGVSGGVITSVSVAGAARGSYTVAPSNPISVTGGTGSGATFNATFGVNSTITITNAGSGYVEQPTVTFSGGGGGSGAAAYATVGSGAIIKALGSTGTQGLDFYTASSASNGVPVLRLRDTVSDSYTMLGGTASVATITAQGNTNAVMQITANGSGSVRFATQGVSVTEQMRVAHTASAVNYVQVTGAATTVAPTISFQGSDTNISGSFVSKGSGTLRFLTNTAVEQLRVLHTGSAVNYTTATGNIAGSAPVFGVAGSDTNIDLTLTPKGTGNVRFGTYTAGVLTPTGYIEVKDSGGTVRRLLVG